MVVSAMYAAGRPRDQHQGEAVILTPPFRERMADLVLSTRTARWVRAERPVQEHVDAAVPADVRDDTRSRSRPGQAARGRSEIRRWVRAGSSLVASTRTFTELCGPDRSARAPEAQAEQPRATWKRIRWMRFARRRVRVATGEGLEWASTACHAAHGPAVRS
jgi:hypothetical protein